MFVTIPYMVLLEIWRKRIKNKVPRTVANDLTWFSQNALLKPL